MSLNEKNIDQWDPARYISRKIKSIRKEVGESDVICVAAGDMNSTITATIMNQAIGSRAKCIFIETGLMRDSETAYTLDLLRNKIGLNIWHSDAKSFFLSRLHKVVDLSSKIYVINKTFIDSLTRSTLDIKAEFKFLATGNWGNSAHDDVGESYRNQILNEMNVTLINPLRGLSKSQVLDIAEFLELPREMDDYFSTSIEGLSEFVMGEITGMKMSIIREVDYLLNHEIDKLNHPMIDNIIPFVSLLETLEPFSSADGNPGKYAVALKLVVYSNDTSQYKTPLLPEGFWEEISLKITNMFPNVSRVFVDVSTTPSGII